MEKYWYQIETVKKVLRYFHGRVLLCDEVGLGKTIEAGMLIKEYVLRGMVKNILILTPASLVSQWRDEMDAKFGLRFITTDDIEFMRDHAGIEYLMRYSKATYHQGRRTHQSQGSGAMYPFLSRRNQVVKAGICNSVTQ